MGTSTSSPPLPRPVDVELKDGSTVRVRPVNVSDQTGLADLLRRLSPPARRNRFFGAVDPDEAARALIVSTGADQVGLVAIGGIDGEVLGHAQYLGRPGAPVAEIALAVSDGRRGRGIGTLLLAHLAQRAAGSGIDTLEALVMRDNHEMMAMFRSSGFPTEVRSEEGTHRVRLPTRLTAAAIASYEERERHSASAMIQRLLAPASVAVVGASRRRGTVGAEVLDNLISGGFQGRIYPVNPHAATIGGLPAYADVAGLPEPVDLAIIAVPAARVLEVARACARRGTRAMVVLSAGFDEVGGEGLARQSQLLAICRAAGIRLVGPNCLGVLSTGPGAALNATFATPMPPSGGVAMLSQSGGVGIALLEGAREFAIGISAFVSVGNKADISGNDLLNHWRSDPSTDVVMLYLESFGNPRRFARIAPGVAREKPVIAMKGGRGAAGARAAASHTGALIGASDGTVDALFAHSGVIRARTLSEMFDIARLLSAQPVPVGRRVGIVTNAGGPGILCADACEEHGLEVVQLDEPVRRRLSEFALPEASLANPVDLLAAGAPEHFGRAVRELAECGGVDALIVIYIEPGLGGAGPEVTRAVRAQAHKPGSPPMALVLMSAGDREAARRGSARNDPPVYSYPEAAARAVAHAVRYGEWRARPVGAVPHHDDVDPARATALLSHAVVGGECWLGPEQVAELLASYRLPLVATRVARGVDEAGCIAAEIGGPVALKAVAPTLVHKTDAGAVQLGLEGSSEVVQAAREIRRRVAAAGHALTGFIVQPMAPAGVEVLVGSTADPQFGPVIVCGAGGTDAEVQRDFALRLTPLSDTEAAAMVRELRLLPLLEGWRGAPTCDIGALEDLLLRLAAMVHAHPQITELDCNPVSVSPAGAVILDARVRVAPAPEPAPWPSLRATPPVATAAGRG